MISNERAQRLIAADAETLTALMACAYAAGADMLMPDGAWNDPHIRRLIEAARADARLRVVNEQMLERWNKGSQK